MDTNPIRKASVPKIRQRQIVSIFFIFDDCIFPTAPTNDKCKTKFNGTPYLRIYCKLFLKGYIEREVLAAKIPTKEAYNWSYNILAIYFASTKF